MKKEISLKVKPKFVNKYKSGYPLISKESIANPNELSEEGSMIKLVDEQHRFIAKGYYGKQNKGLGWVLSKNEREV
ncbi:MAG: rRNA methyltransferase, partial [Neobacillus sp.]|nr:rRNA methyltransferase [Neobacillus sp.]